MRRWPATPSSRNGRSPSAPCRAPALPPFAGLPTSRAPLQAAPAPDALPWTVYYGNLHSQSNHSDGGGAVADCKGAQAPQSAPFGPDAAWSYARKHGLDMLMVSEHNHMYDGAEGTNPDADPEQARALYRSGLDSARAFNAGQRDFLACTASNGASSTRAAT
jgi:hypothetical protein